MEASVAAARTGKATFGDYISITKPRIIILVTLTAWAAMFLAAEEPPSPRLLIVTLLGTALAVAGSHTFNAYIDRDIDALMNRTRGRPLPTGRMQPAQALAYAFVLAILSFVLMVWGGNLISAVLAQVGLLFYVFVYTMWLKRTTPLNTLIGGIAGAIPPLVGAAAVTGRVEVVGMVLFALMVLWQPPHFFALTLLCVEDYRRANVPMLPVVRGTEITTLRIALYSVALVLLSFVLYPLGIAGMGYLITAILFGVAYIALAFAAVWNKKVPVKTWGKRLFVYSWVYLAALFIAMVVFRV